MRGGPVTWALYSLVFSAVCSANLIHTPPYKETIENSSLEDSSVSNSDVSTTNSGRLWNKTSVEQVTSEDSSRNVKATSDSSSNSDANNISEHSDNIQHQLNNSTTEHHVLNVNSNISSAETQNAMENNEATHQNGDVTKIISGNLTFSSNAKLSVTSVTSGIKHPNNALSFNESVLAPVNARERQQRSTNITKENNNTIRVEAVPDIFTLFSQFSNEDILSQVGDLKSKGNHEKVEDSQANSPIEENYEQIKTKPNITLNKYNTTFINSLVQTNDYLTSDMSNETDIVSYATNRRTTNENALQMHESDLARSRKKAKYMQYMPFLLIPALIFTGLVPWVLPVVKMVTMFAGILNNFIFMQALFTLIRNYIFNNDKKEEHIVYFNHGYKKHHTAKWSKIDEEPQSTSTPEWGENDQEFHSLNQQTLGNIEHPVHWSKTEHGNPAKLAENDKKYRKNSHGTKWISDKNNKPELYSTKWPIFEQSTLSTNKGKLEPRPSRPPKWEVNIKKENAPTIKYKYEEPQAS